MTRAPTEPDALTQNEWAALTAGSPVASPVTPVTGDEQALAAVAEPVWQDFANCRGCDPDPFFPERGADHRKAKDVCRSCVVRYDCAEHGIAHEHFGIWGGLSDRERRRIRRERALARRAS